MEIEGLHGTGISLVIAPHTSIVALTRHPEYAIAKAGDEAAARNVVAAFIREQRLPKATNAIVVPVIAIEATGYNAIPLLFAHEIARVTGSELESNIIQSQKVFHTGAPAFERLLRKPEFIGPVTSGANYIIVDDVSTSGSTLMALKNYIEKNNGTVVAAVALAIAKHSSQLTLTDETAYELQKKFGSEILNFIAKYGYDEIAQLSESQGRYLLKFSSIDSIRSKISENLGEAGYTEPEQLSEEEQHNLREWAAHVCSQVALSGTPDTQHPTLTFQCSSCGECCRRIGIAVETTQRLRSDGGTLTPLQEQFANFPYPILPDGSCSKLDVFGQCRVYEDRPEVCKVSSTFKMLAKPLGLTQEQYYSLTGQMCNKWQKESGIDEKFRVKENYV